MSRSIFGWSYPPGCSGPPEGDSICPICGGDCESELNPNRCICDLVVAAQENYETGDARTLADGDLARLRERFGTAALNLLNEQKRRYNLKPVRNAHSNTLNI